MRQIVKVIEVTPAGRKDRLAGQPEKRKKNSKDFTLSAKILRKTTSRRHEKKKPLTDRNPTVMGSPVNKGPSFIYPRGSREYSVHVQNRQDNVGLSGLAVNLLLIQVKTTRTYLLHEIKLCDI